MALELPYGYKNLNPEGSSNVDESYGYYNSVEEACLAVPLAMRKGGRTVGIKDGSGKITEYWWENDNDLTDSGLVIKNAGGGGGGDAVWGSITGAIQDQADLVEEFEKKADKDEIPDDFNPAEHDLDEFKNESSNPYVRENQIPDPFDPTYLENEIQSLEENKVDKEPGKGLSDENFSLEEKEKLANIEEGAQVNVIPDWEADTSNPRRIDNKPTKTSDFINDGATGVSPYAEMRDIEKPDAILSANTVLNANWNGRDVITAGYSLTVNPNTQDYKDSFEVYLYNNSTTDSAIVLNAKAGVTYTVIDNDVSSATVYLQAYGTAVIKRIGNTQNYIVRGYII